MIKTLPCRAALRVLPAMLLAACHPAPEPTPFPELSPVSVTRTKATTDIGGSKGMWIPDNAFITRSGFHGVFVERDGRARFQLIRPGQRRGNYIQVLSGLFGGEKILAGDLENVHDGSPLIGGEKTDQ